MILRACFLSLLGIAAIACSAQAPSGVAAGGSDASTLPGDATAPQTDGSAPQNTPDGSTTATGDDSGNTAPTDAGPPFDGPDLDMKATDFECVLRWAKVGDFRITNKLADAGDAIAVANLADGGERYPVGTIIQLIPNEAIVKRHVGFDPSLNDWEFFNLTTSASGTVINQRGGAEVTNAVGSCASCHQPAAAQFDFVCATTHGCNPLPFTEGEILAVQNADPRCP